MVGRILLLMVLLPLALWSMAEERLEIIPLRHRTAEQLLPQLTPFVEPTGVINGRGDTLYLRASSGNRAEIMRLIENLDQPARQLLISVRHGDSAQRHGQGGELSGSVGGSGVRIIRSGSTLPKSGTVEINRGNSQIEASGFQASTRSEEEIDQRVQVMEGGRAFIQVGQSIPLPMRQVILRPNGAVVSETTQWHDIGTGFYAAPQLVGDRVTLDISPLHERAGDQPGATETREISTTVSGRLGEWINLGGSDQRSSEGRDGSGYRATEGGSNSFGIWLKVDELR